MPNGLSKLPPPILLAVAGLSATVLMVVTAVAVRTPPYEELERDAPAEETRGGASADPVASEAPDVAPTRKAPGAGGAPSAAARTPPPALDEDARAVRAQLSKDLQFGRFKGAVEALARLVELAPKAAEDPEVRADVVELSMRVMLLQGSEPETVFNLITTRMGTTGIDILYELVTTRGGSRAAARADELMRDEGVRARGTPAVRVAYELRTAKSCDEKKALFARAKKDGDGRTLGQLQLLNQRCGRRSPGCCLHNDPELRETIDAIKARMN